MRNRMRYAALGVAVLIAMTSIAGCGGSGNSAADTAGTTAAETSTENGAESSTEDVAEAATESAMIADTEEEIADAAATEEVIEEDPGPQPLEVPEGMYLSELTGEPISESLKDQRPIAVMVDNDERALKHYGTAQADVVYEMVNSTANNRVTRLMCLYKDWENVPQIGSIRSLRPTNILLAQEWDAIIIHDGGPYYINDYLSRYGDHLSGGFSRVSNGKAREFTEYVLTGDIDKKLAKASFTSTYGDDVPTESGEDADTITAFTDVNSHFNFVEYGLTAELEPYATSDDVRPAQEIIKFPFPHNSSELHYNADTQEYEYYEYGEQHLDADTDAAMSFTNVILQNATLQQLDEHGYCIYDCINVNFGYYITKGELISIVWKKTSESDVTRYYDTEGNEIDINTGKTYIGIIPADAWDDLEIY